MSTADAETDPDLEHEDDARRDVDHDDQAPREEPRPVRFGLALALLVASLVFAIVTMTVVFVRFG
jgi:hypothetical protein